ncbi:MAG: hypothetical protein K0Q95_3364 [Bacteroidota bacterium]|jgi:hypothetical protein|nr:hypothetical protein [Bacteroidota bacterium]
MSKDAQYKEKDYNNYNLTFPEVPQLLDRIEVLKRRKIKDSDQRINYIDPLNHIKTLINPVNHLIIGRRGSGKTSLLIKLIEEIKKTNGLVITIDMQSKNRQSSDLPLLEILTKLIKECKLHLEAHKDWQPYLTRKAQIKYYSIVALYKGLTKKDLWTNETIELDKLYNALTAIVNHLELITKTPNGACIKISKLNKESNSKSGKLSVKSAISADAKYLEIIKASASVDCSYTLINEKEDVSSKNFEYTLVYSKQEALNELKGDIIATIESFFKIIKKPVYLILDDFYQIPIINQPYIFQYLHDINKETSSSAFSFKVCLVPHRFKLNEENNKILSHKDDFSTINLDRDFYELEDNKDLLFKILCGLDPSLEFTSTRITKLFHDSLLINDCIRASGALPRYFLDVFSHMVKYSIAENQYKIHRMVLTQVIKEIKKSKDELITEEAYLPESKIRMLTRIIEEEVVHGLKTNVILYPYKSFKANEEILVSLINLGYLHRVKEDVLVKGDNYIPLFVDMIFTHTKSDKMPKNFKDVKFWTQNGKYIGTCPVWEFSKAKISALENINLN